MLSLLDVRVLGPVDRPPIPPLAVLVLLLPLLLLFLLGHEGVVDVGPDGLVVAGAVEGGGLLPQRVAVITGSAGRKNVENMIS